MVIPKRNGSSLSLKLLNSAPLWVFARISVPLLFVIVDLKLSLSLSLGAALTYLYRVETVMMIMMACAPKTKHRSLTFH